MSHVNIDFDGFASMYAAKKLYPNATVVLTDLQHPTVKQYLAIYRDQFQFSSFHSIEWDKVCELILVDVANLQRVGLQQKMLSKKIKIIVYDHHPITNNSVHAAHSYIEEVGATVTLLLKEIMTNKISITSFEATLFGLALYTDTGFFTYSTTTSSDLFIGSYLLEQGMDLELVNRFSDQLLLNNEQELLSQLLTRTVEHHIDDQLIVVTSFEQATYQGGLASIVHKLLDTTHADAIFVIVKMGKHVYVVARSQSERVNVRKLILRLGGDGHQRAASATIKNSQSSPVTKLITEGLDDVIIPAISAQLFMVTPVKMVSMNLSINEVAEKMFQYGHTGFPVIDENNQLVGVISRRDVDKAVHHGLGHAPVKAYMSEKPITLSPTATLEKIQETMIQHNIGRIPIVQADKILGIISRTDIIEVLHNKHHRQELFESAKIIKEKNLSERLKKQINDKTYTLIKELGRAADSQFVQAYLVGGFVRDLLLGRPNEDIDVVVEGNAIAFAHHLANTFDGSVKEHDTFGTATWTTSSATKIDIVSCRTEFYSEPGALPTVQLSNIKEDIARRDFTINAMAMQLNKDSFGEILDFYKGKEDIVNKEIRVLHNLSFVEDPTRILRATRFASRFGYSLSNHTEKLAIISLDKLQYVSRSRIIHELELLFSEASHLKTVSLLYYLRVWDVLIKKQPTERQLHHLSQLSTSGEKTFDWFMLLTSLVYGNANWENQVQPYAEKSVHKKFIEQLLMLSNYSFSELTSYGMIHYDLKPLQENVLTFYALQAEDSLRHFLFNYLRKRSTLKSFLTGSDLIDLGLKQGPLFSVCLLQLECLMLDDKISTKTEALNWVSKTYTRN